MPDEVTPFAADVLSGHEPKLPCPAVVCRPPATVSHFMAAHDIRGMACGLNDRVGRHDDQTHPIWPAERTSEGNPEIKFHAGAHLADVVLIPCPHNDRGAGIGVVEFLWRKHPKLLGQCGATSNQEGNTCNGNAHTP